MYDYVLHCIYLLFKGIGQVIDNQNSSGSLNYDYVIIGGIMMI